MTVRIDRLDARGVVDVRDRRDVRALDAETVEALDRVLSAVGSTPLHPNGSNRQHVRIVLAGGHLEIVGRALAQNSRRERAKTLAKLHLEVHHRLHLRIARIAEQASRPERPRTELHPS